MVYKVEKIDEDIDFGCEERAEDMPVMAVVTLKNDSGETVVRKFEDAKLTADNIMPGDRVIIDESGLLRRTPDEDWTKSCTRQNVDIQKLTSMMLDVKKGLSVDWKCPFCGEKVELLEQDGGHTVIGCTSCDMRITLDN